MPEVIIPELLKLVWTSRQQAASARMGDLDATRHVTFHPGAAFLTLSGGNSWEQLHPQEHDDE